MRLLRRLRDALVAQTKDAVLDDLARSIDRELDKAWAKLREIEEVR